MIYRHQTIQGLIDMLDPHKGAVVLNASSTVTSYRGYYNQLAIAPGDGVSVRNLIRVLKGAIGEQFDGYKGGAWTMEPDTNVWLSPYGHSSGLMIVGYDESSRHLILCEEPFHL